MSSSAPRRGRLPVAYIGATYFESATTIAGLILAGVLFTLRPDVWLGTRAWLLIGPLLILRLLSPIVRWLVFSFTVSDRGLSTTTGLFTRRTRTVMWSDVRVVETDAPWSHRLFRLARVALVQGGGEETRFELPAIDASTRQRIIELAHGYGAVADGEGVHEGEGGDGASGVVPDIAYRATVADLLVASLVYGQFAVAGAAALVATIDVVDRLALTDAVLGLIEVGPVVVAIGVMVATIAVGALLTIVRFWNFQVQRYGSQSIVLSHGLLSRRERVIEADSIVGIEFVSNPIELALGRVRLSLMTTDSASRLGTNLVLPSLPRPVVGEMLRGGFSRWLPEDRIASTTRPFVGRALGAMVGVGLPVVLLVVLTREAWPMFVVVLLALSVVVVLWMAGRLLSARHIVDAGRPVISVRSRFIVDRERIIDASFVHLLSVTAVRSQIVLVRSYYYAGIPRAMTVMRVSRGDVARLAALVQTHAPRAGRRIMSRQREEVTS